MINTRLPCALICPETGLGETPRLPAPGIRYGHGETRFGPRDRAPFGHVAETVSTMIKEGITVSLKPVDGADHFMLFSHGDLVIGMITRWLRER